MSFPSQDSTQQINPLIFQSLFEEVKEIALPAIWTKGVGLARSSQVSVVKQSTEETTLRVKIATSSTATNVRLSPSQRIWECDSLSEEDPSIYVVIALIAVRNGNVRTNRLAQSISYTLIKEENDLFLKRYLVHPTLGKEELISLKNAVCKSNQNNEELHLQKCDTRIDDLLQFQQPLTEELLYTCAPALAEIDSLFWDGQKVKLSIFPLTATIRVDEMTSGYHLYLSSLVVSEPHVWITPYLLATQSTLRVFDQRPLPRMLRGEGTRLSFEQAGLLFNQMIPKLKDHFEVDIRVKKTPTFVNVKPRVTFTAETRGNDGIWLHPQMVYGDPILAEVVHGELRLRSRSKIPTRDEASEARAIQNLPELFRNFQPQEFHGSDAVEIIAKLAPFLTFTPEMKHLTPVGEVLPHLITNEDSSLSFYCEGQTVSSEQVLQSWQGGSGLLQLDDGRWATLPSEWLASIAAQGEELLELLLAKRINIHNAPRLSPLLREAGVKIPAEWNRFLSIIEGTMPSAEPFLTSSISALIRPYQKSGITWLSTLQSCNVGCLLADDMGLGKTLQTLAVLPSKTLIVAPTSVLGSWQQQAHAYRPELLVNLYHGNNRVLNLEADIVVTSYTLLRTEKDKLQGPWNALVVDESQIIKNPYSLTYEALRSINALWRIALTGTPVENRKLDLWAQLELLNPGLLPNPEEFEAWKDDKIARVARPFILRRTKEQVAQDLPTKTTITLECELSSEERAVYDAVLYAAKNELKADETKGKVSALMILEALLRLRQTCCHPGLVTDEYRHLPSAKLDLLMDSLSNSLAGSHPVLIFSQWVSFLDIISSTLHTEGIEHLRLDGTTKNRQNIVDAFQRPDGPSVMLISLKAGGVGLTLTRAQHVYLMDPWWNPAVEEQAADRVHRIGQKNPVFIYKLIAQNTIEEKVLWLQESKLALAEALLSDSDSPLTANGGSTGQWSLEDMKALLS
jgi:hypothetical protein